MVGPLQTDRVSPTAVEVDASSGDALATTTLPPASADELDLRNNGEVLVAGLPGSQLLGGLRDSAVSTYQRGVNEVTRLRNETVNLVNDALQTPLGQGLVGTGRALINTGGDVIDALRHPVRTGERLWNFTTERIQEFPAAVEQLVRNPGQTLQDIRLGAQQTANDAVLYLAQNGFPGMPPSMREHGIVEFRVITVSSYVIR